MKGLKHTADFTIRTYEIDNQKRGTVTALVKLLHEAAMQHVIDLRLSVWDLEPHHVSWVLLRKDLRIIRLPQLGERIRITTYPAGFRRSFTYRDYIATDESNQRIASAASTWLLMDTRKRKMAPLHPFLEPYEKHMPNPADCLPRPEGRIPVLEQAEFTSNFRVDWHDLDFNQHLNNTRYLQWMLDSLPLDVLESRHPQSLRIEYRSEALYHDHLIAEAQRTGNRTFLHRLRRADSEEVIATAESTWTE